jgi:hypothetical protein
MNVKSTLFDQLQYVDCIENLYKMGEPVSKLHRLKDLDSDQMLLFATIKKDGDFAVISGEDLTFMTYRYYSGPIEFRVFSATKKEPHEGAL